jgi:glycosyltransferase involved in cell wall biosynthesis
VADITLNPSDAGAVRLAADVINERAPQAIFLQHEFKLFGGLDGEHVMEFLTRVKGPLVTTLHTVSGTLTEQRERVFRAVLMRSATVIVFSAGARCLLADRYGLASDKISIIPHGVPDVPFTEPGNVALPGVRHQGVLFVTCGLVRPGKGIEHVLPALAALKRTGPAFTFVVVGANHPRSAAAVDYRAQLTHAVTAYGLEDDVVFLDRFQDWPSMLRAMQACDAGVCAYTAPQQSSSGVLALLLACGRPVIATDFPYARDVINGRNGIVVPIASVPHLTEAFEEIITNPTRRREMARASYEETRDWVWPEVAAQHLRHLDELTGSEEHQ